MKGEAQVEIVPEFRPRPPAALADAAFEVVRRAPGTMLALSALANLPAIAAIAALALFIRDEGLSWGSWRYFVPLAPLSLLVGVGLWLRAVGTGALAHASAVSASGRAPSAGESLGSAFSAGATLGVVCAVRFVATTIGLVFFALPGVLVAWFGALAPHAVVIERRGIGEAVPRAVRLAPRAAFGLVGAAALLLFGWPLLTVELLLAVRLVESAIGSVAPLSGELLARPETPWIALALAKVLIDPFVSASAAMSWIDARIRVEGMDLELRAQGIRGETLAIDPRRGSRAAGKAAALAVLALGVAVPRAARAAGADAIPPSRLASDLQQGAKLFRQNPDPASASAYAKALSDVQVRWNGRTIDVRDPWLGDALDGVDGLKPADRKARMKAIADHLAARAALLSSTADDSKSAATGPAKPAPADPGGVLASILDQSQYHAPPEDPKLASAAAKVRDRVRSGWQSVKDFFHELFAPKERKRTIWDWAKELLASLLAAGGVAFLVWMVVRAVMRASVDAARAAPETDMPEQPPQPVVMETEAGRLASAGDLRGAVRALYLALLGRLHREGAIVYDRRRTNREYLRAFRGGERRAQAFATVVETFDRKWYGRESCSQEELADFDQQTQRAAGDVAKAESAA